MRVRYDLSKMKGQRNPYLKGLKPVNLQAALAIRKARAKAGLSQAALARMVGTSQSGIARLEDAEYTGHTLKLLTRIAVACKHHVSVKLEPMGGR